MKKTPIDMENICFSIELQSKPTVQFTKEQITKKNAWIPEQDKELMKIIREFGGETNRWSEIGKRMKNRSGKQCRERYHNHLKADIKRGDWTQEEDDSIWKLQAEFNGQWAYIAKTLTGRSASAVKNRWHLVCRKITKENEAQKQFQKMTHTKYEPETSMDCNASVDLANTSRDSNDSTSDAYSNDANEDVRFTSEEEAGWIDYLLGSCSEDSWQVPEVVAVAPCIPDVPKTISLPIVIKEEAIKEEVVESSPSLLASTASTQRSNSPPGLNLIRDSIEGMQFLTLNCKLSLQNVDYDAPSPCGHTWKASSKHGHRLLSPHQRPSPIMLKKRACQMNTPRLSSQLY